jgi:4-hydroxybenzoate polyprenyltransferase
LQHNVSQRLKEYLLLIRLPNIFTVPSNILTGYFASVPVVEADSVQLIALMVSSALLYVGGIVLNDYFDIEIDKRERPFRPLPSGKISKRDALAIAMVAILIANSIALVLGPTSLAVSLILTFAIILYDYRLKHGFSGPFAMGGARFLNVIFGASPVLLYLDNHSRAIVLAAAGSLFLYIMAITFLSKKEAGNERANSTIVLLMVFGVDVCCGYGCHLQAASYQRVTFSSKGRKKYGHLNNNIRLDIYKWDSRPCIWASNFASYRTCYSSSKKVVCDLAFSSLLSIINKC